MHHRRALTPILLASTVLPACYSPHDQASTGESGEDESSSDATFGESGSGTAGPTTSATMTSTSASSTTDVGTSTGGGEPVCGDGVVEGDEVCDDGINDGSYDGCEADCMSLGPHCGDEVPQGDEACDDGDDINGNGCNIDCIESGTVLWTRTLDAGGFAEVAIDSEDGVLVAGVGAEDSRYFDVDGNEQWTATYDYPGATGTSAAAVAFHPTHHWMLGGRANTPTESYNLWWRGYSEAGAGATTSVYDNPASSADEMGGMVFDGAGNLYVLGDSNRDDLGQGTNIWLRKHDASGDERWTQTYDGDEDDVAKAIAIGHDDNVVVGGYTYEDGDRNAWLRKYGPEGNELWTRTNASAPGYWDEVLDLAVGADLEVVAVGVEDLDLWVRKYSADGDEEWTETHGDPFMCLDEGCAWSDSGNGVAVDSTGAVIVVGDQMSSNHGLDIVIRKYDADGNVLWTDIVLAPAPQESLDHTANDVVVTSTDDIVVVGDWDESGIGGSQLQWIRKYAP